MGYSHALADDEKRELLRIARATLKEFLVSGRIPPGAPHRQSLLLPAGVFVSLSSQPSGLRGCVGSTTDIVPLYKSIQEMTVAAASRDPRFEPIRQDELSLLTIEVSILGERRPIQRAEEIEIGTHGVCVALIGRRGLLLPQVAVEHGWDGEVFLEKVCEKAGVAKDGWREPGAVAEIFTAQVFSEKTHPPLVAPRR